MVLKVCNITCRWTKYLLKYHLTHNVTLSVHLRRSNKSLCFIYLPSLWSPFTIYFPFNYFAHLFDQILFIIFFLTLFKRFICYSLLLFAILFIYLFLFYLRLWSRFFFFLPLALKFLFRGLWTLSNDIEWIFFTPRIRIHTNTIILYFTTIEFYFVSENLSSRI